MIDTLLVAAKQPSPGLTKTRLCPPLTSAQASELYECFLRDTLDTMRLVPGVQRRIGFLPKQAQGYFRHLAPDMELAPQQGASLGERLDRLLSEALDEGSPRAVVIDSDSPTLPAAYILIAFERLEEVDVVLGPTEDGGYYLIGLSKPQPHLLRQVQMSTSHVLRDTVALAKATGLSVALLPTWYDVDTIADLRWLNHEVDGLSDNRVAATRDWLRANQNALRT
jgi:rSAM/selenodomain-associated transferase 1